MLDLFLRAARPRFFSVFLQMLCYLLFNFFKKKNCYVVGWLEELCMIAWAKGQMNICQFLLLSHL